MLVSADYKDISTGTYPGKYCGRPSGVILSGNIPDNYVLRTNLSCRNHLNTLKVPLLGQLQTTKQADKELMPDWRTSKLEFDPPSPPRTILPHINITLFITVFIRRLLAFLRPNTRERTMSWETTRSILYTSIPKSKKALFISKFPAGRRSKRPCRQRCCR